MLYTQKLLAELERKREHLASYQSRYGRQLAAYRDALATLGTRFPTAEALLAAQERALAAQPGVLSAGARPAAEYDSWRAHAGGAGAVPRLPFGRTFPHHQPAPASAERLRAVTTRARRGSQLPPR